MDGVTQFCGIELVDFFQMRYVCRGLVWVMYTGQGCCGRHCCNSCTNEGGDKCRLRAARAQSSLLNAVSITRAATGSPLMRSHSAGLGPVSPLYTHHPWSPWTAKPTAGTVSSWQHLNRAASQQQALAYVYGGVAQEGGLGAGQYAEIGPYHVVKNMLLQCGDGGRQGMYRHRGVALSAYGVEHQRQRSNMVEVAVAEQDMVDAQHLLDGQVAHAGASIDQDVLIEQKRGGAAS